METVMFSAFLSFLTPEFVGKMVRTGVQTASGGLVTKGLISGDDQTAIAGAIALVASLVWTAIAHAKQAPAVPANPTTGGFQ